VRYLEVDLGAGGGRLIPMPLAKITWKGVRVHSLFADQFANVPGIAGDGVVTKLEEDKISAYYAGGKLFGARSRRSPQLEPIEA
jgi:photosynthetic reaction center H subunit